LHECKNNFNFMFFLIDVSKLFNTFESVVQQAHRLAVSGVDVVVQPYVLSITFVLGDK